MRALRRLGPTLAAAALLGLAPAPVPMYGFAVAAAARERVDEGLARLEARAREDPFPAVTRAYASGSSPALTTALAGARTAIDDATKNLL